MVSRQMNSFDEFILQFITQQRNTLPDADEETVNQLLYKKFDNVLQAVLFKNAPEIKLIITRSYQRYSLLLPAKQKGEIKYYLLYDKHLIEYLKLLNAIFLLREDTEPDLWKFAYQLFSEETYLEKENILALYTALNASALGLYYCEDLLSAEENKMWIGVQTDYILAHEVGHWLYGLKQYEEERNNAIDEINILLYEVYERYLNIYREQDYIQIISESVNKIRTEGIIVEECFCDAVAFSYIFKKIEKNECLETKLGIVKSLFLCLMHMQLLAMCNFTVNDERNYDIANSIRISFFRNYIVCFFARKEQNELKKTLESTIITYENKITNIILPIFNTVEERLDNLYDSIGSDDLIINLTRD